MSLELDKADKIILECIQVDGGISITSLADKCSLSVASIQRRLKRLKKLKIIEREVAVLNPKLLGHDMTFIVKVELERESKEQHNKFRKTILSETHVQQCYYITGEEDFVLICIVPNMEEFERLTQRLFFENDNVRRFKTSVVMDRSKVGLTVSLEHLKD